MGSHLVVSHLPLKLSQKNQSSRELSNISHLAFERKLYSLFSKHSLAALPPPPPTPPLTPPPTPPPPFSLCLWGMGLGSARGPPILICLTCPHEALGKLFSSRHSPASSISRHNSERVAFAALSSGSALLHYCQLCHHR